MKRIKLTQGKYALVDDLDFEWLNQYKWCALKDTHTFYVGRAVVPRPETGKKMITMHRMILGLGDPKILCDHKDGNGLNNQRENLRIATSSENGMNRRKSKGCHSKYIGVTLHKRSGKWQAMIMKNKKSFYLGWFSLEKNAAKAYNEKAIELHGEFANLNKIS